MVTTKKIIFGIFSKFRGLFGSPPIDSVGGGRSLISANFVQCDNHGGVDSARDVEKGTGDALRARDAAFIKFRCGRGVGRLLHLSPIRTREPFVLRVLRARGYGVLGALQGFADGVGYGDVGVIARVIPFDGKPAVIAVRWVDSDGVILPEGIEEVGASSAANNLILKSSTARAKVVGRVAWVQRQDMCTTGAYQWGWMLQTRRL